MNKYILLCVICGACLVGGRCLATSDVLNIANNDTVINDNTTATSTANTVDSQVSVKYFKAKITNILGSSTDNDTESPGYNQDIQKVEATIMDGPELGKVEQADYFPKSQDPGQKLKLGEIVYLQKVTEYGQTSYSIADRYRLSKLWWLALIFIALVLSIGRWKGFGSLIGLAFSFYIIIKWILPAVLAGHNALLACFLGAMVIAVVSIYVAHGFNLRTSVAVASTLLTIGIAIGLDYLVVHWLQLFGVGSEEAVYAQFAQSGAIINMRGLLLGGIIIGVLGILDDITTAQTAVVDELKKANPALKFKELYRGGLSVGKEHIASLINTLVLAYVGASFPLILLFNYNQQPLGYTLSSELVAEEIARALIGGATLILAVPIATALIALVLSKFKNLKPSQHQPTHSHG